MLKKVNACSMASNKVVGLVHVKMKKKEEINPFLLMKSFIKLGSRKNVSSTKNKVYSFLLFQFVSKKLIVMTQN